jgi:energy-coupling factor transport system ATP-binding protein
VIAVRDLAVVFPDGTVGLAAVDLDVAAGERVLVTGPSGGGKTTLARVLAGLQAPSSGTVACASSVGFVFQEPGDQLLAGTVGEEIALCARAAGVPVDVAALLATVGLDVPATAVPTELSGGQQQRLAVAACLAGQRRILVLDEPLAHLDPAGARALLAVLDGVAATGVAVVLIEHRLSLARPWADRTVLVVGGQVRVGPFTTEELEEVGLTAPAEDRVARAGGLAALGPRRPREGQVGAVLWEGQVGGRSFAVRAGERIAWMGSNGAGKSTLLEAWADGVDGVVAVPQDPDLSLFGRTVAEELAGADPVPFGLDGLLHRAPQSLSRGQRLRLAVAAALATSPRILVLDEPTAGQDPAAVDTVMAAVAARQAGGAVVFATHDLSLALRWSTRMGIVSRGRLVADGLPGRVVTGPLPALQERQAAAGYPLVDVERQLTGPPGGPVPVQRVASETWHRERVVRRATPVSAVVVLLALGSLAVLLDRALVLWGLAGLSLVQFLRLPVPRRARWATLGAILGVVWTTVLSQGLFYGDVPRTALVRLGPLALWAEGIGWGLVQSARLVAVTLVGVGLATTTSPDRLTALLRALRVPAVLAFLAVMAVRFIPTVVAEGATVDRARRRRGHPLRVGVLRPLVARAYRRALRLADSLDSRGFDVRSPPVEAAGWTVGDRLVGVSAVLVVGAVATAQLVTAAYLWEVAYDPRLRPLYAWVHRWL